MKRATARRRAIDALDGIRAGNPTERARAIDNIEQIIAWIQRRPTKETA